jgi:cell division protein ZapD
LRASALHDKTTLEAASFSFLFPIVQSVAYEQPLNERMRMLLRLEHLFRGLDFALEGDSEWHSRTCIAQLLDVAELMTRWDLRADLAKELERLAGALTAMEDSPAVDRERLQALLDRMDSAIDLLHAGTVPLGQQLLECELIAGLRRRQHLALGNCDFDQPAYLHWLAMPPAARRAQLGEWTAPLEHVRTGMELVLMLVRHSVEPTPETAPTGFYQRSLDPAQPNQLLRILVPAESGLYPEISAGRHRFSVRFLRFTPRGRPPPVDEDVPFRLMCCCL